MGLSMSVGFNWRDVWGVGSLDSCPQQVYIHNINPSEETLHDGDSTEKEEPSDREQVSISCYL